MKAAVKVLDFETAAILRDEIRALEAKLGRGGKKKTGRERLAHPSR
jgi:protein-arginine kinase activator protein McsA